MPWKRRRKTVWYKREMRQLRRDLSNLAGIPRLFRPAPWCAYPDYRTKRPRRKKAVPGGRLPLSALSSSLRRFAGGMLAALLLLPIPTFAAITWQGTFWSFVGVPSGSPAPTRSDVLTGNVDTLTIDLGSGSGTSQISVDRSFTAVQGDGLNLALSENFNLAAGGTGGAQVQIKKGSSLLATPIQQTYSGGTSGNQFSGFPAATGTWTAGSVGTNTYTALVTISLTGSWTSSSPYTITFTPF